MTPDALKLHGYWRSGTSYRVRIALNLKGSPYEQVPVNLLAGEQVSSGHLAYQPQGLVPALEVPEGTLIQSSAILEWIEETQPGPALLPKVPFDRARVRAMAMIVACDIHPLNNLRVQRLLKDQMAANQLDLDNWIARWIVDGFTALEQLIKLHGGRFSFGDKPTLADCHLIPQVYSAERFGVDLTPFPRIAAVNTRLMDLPEVRSAHPDCQPDTPKVTSAPSR